MRNYGVVRLDSIVTAATVAAGYQPLDTDLTAIAALATTSYGRALLGLANQAALVALLPSYQPLDSDLTAIAALTTTSFGRALLSLADAAALRTAAGLAAIAASGSASDLSAGTVPTARLGSGSASSSTYLRGDQTWATVSGGGGGLVVGDITGATDIGTGLTNDDVLPLANDPGGTPVLRKASLSRVKEQTGGLLACTSYNPSTSATYTRSNTAFADVDATNLTATFTFPASGSVLVRLSACVNTSVSTAGHYWNLRDGSGDITGTKSTACGNVGLAAASASIKLAGTPGASQTIKWGFASSSGHTSTIAVGQSSSFGPATIEVWSVPQ